VTHLVVPDLVVDETFARLRECGAGRTECVVYWCADLDHPSLVTHVVHPGHTASPFGYEVSSNWVTTFFLDLRARRQTVAAQVHTHPGPAHHSGLDDRFALAPATGFLSLVIPDFAAGDPDPKGWHLVMMQPDGAWQPVAAPEVLIHG
jgi:proteasome lid subunit RPN8/RPN11